MRFDCGPSISEGLVSARIKLLLCRTSPACFLSGQGYLCLSTLSFFFRSRDLQFLSALERGLLNTYTYIYIHIHTYTYIYIHIHTYTYIYVHIRTYTYIYIHIHTYTYIYIHIHTYTYIYIHIHTYTYIHIHTYIHTYIQMYTYHFSGIFPYEPSMWGYPHFGKPPFTVSV